MGRPRSFDETAAVAAASSLFARSGYEGTSVDDLVRGLGIHRGSLYSSFGSKRALYLRVLGEHVAGLAAGPPADGLEPGDLTLLLRAAVERAPVDEDTAELVRRGLAALEQRLPPAGQPAEVTSGASAGTPSAALAQLLGNHLIRRAVGPHHPQEDQ